MSFTKGKCKFGYDWCIRCVVPLSWYLFHVPGPLLPSIVLHNKKRGTNVPTFRSVGPEHVVQLIRDGRSWVDKTKRWCDGPESLKQTFRVTLCVYHSNIRKFPIYGRKLWCSCSKLMSSFLKGSASLFVIQPRILMSLLFPGGRLLKSLGYPLLGRKHGVDNCWESLL